MVREGEGSMRASQVLRAALRPLRAAPEMQRVYREELAARGERAAAVSERIGLQLERAGGARPPDRYAWDGKHRRAAAHRVTAAMRPKTWSNPGMGTLT